MTREKERFQTKKDAVLDTETGLEWYPTCSNPMHWQTSMDFAQSLGKGWRLPTVQELVSIINYDQCDLATDLPKSTGDWMWTATTSRLNINDVYAWVVGTGSGRVQTGYKLNKFSSRYVRTPKKVTKSKK